MLQVVSGESKPFMLPLTIPSHLCMTSIFFQSNEKMFFFSVIFKRAPVHGWKMFQFFILLSVLFILENEWSIQRGHLMFSLSLSIISNDF